MAPVRSTIRRSASAEKSSRDQEELDHRIGQPQGGGRCSVGIFAGEDGRHVFRLAAVHRTSAASNVHDKKCAEHGNDQADADEQCPQGPTTASSTPAIDGWREPQPDRDWSNTP